MSDEREWDDDTLPRPGSEQDPDHTVVASRPDPDRTVVTPRRERAREQRGQIAAPVSDAQQRAPWSAMVYGPRMVPRSAAGEGNDAVLRTIGAPPAAAVAPPASDRRKLPSLAKRFTRVRAWSLVAYAGTVVIAVVGLTIVGRIAFG